MKKMHCLLAALLVVAGLGLAACGDDDTGGNTFSATGLPIPVPGDGSYTNSSIVVTGGPTVISKVTVNVTIHHTNTHELTFSLTSPAGTVLLANACGTSGVAGGYLNVKFDDDAATSINVAMMPAGGYVGSFIPSQPLNEYIGSNANMTWQLYVRETGSTSVNGQLTAWSITFE